MKTSEVVNKYANGERDFRRVNLRGLSFKGRDLSGADFSEADIRGTSFVGANLTGTKFVEAKGGLQKRWVAFSITIAFVLVVIYGFCAAFAGAFVALLFDQPGSEYVIASWVCVVLIILFFALIVRQGFSGAFIIVLPVVFTVVLSAVLPIVLPVVLPVLFTVLPIVLPVVLPIVLPVVLPVVLSVAFTVASTVVLSVAFTVASTVAFTVASTVASTVVFKSMGLSTSAIPMAIAVALIFVLFSAYLSWRSLKGDPRDIWLSTMGIAIAATGGTSFYQANLTNADFTNAILKNTNFRKTNLTRTRFYHTKKLEFARVGETLLIETAVRKLLVTGKGEKQAYFATNLRGANLDGYQLNHANLKRADLSEASLVGTELQSVNLTETQAVGADFTRAYLTGACLEAWNIDATTKLDDVDCQYVFLLQHPHPQTGSRERRPHDPDKTFAPGDFAQLYTKIMNTVQILLRNGVNPEAFQQAWQNLLAEYPEITKDSIQAIEKKGNDVLVTVEVPEDTDKGKVEKEFLQVYEAKLEAARQADLLAAEKRHSQDLKAITLAVLNTGKTNNTINLHNFISPPTDNQVTNRKTILILAANPLDTTKRHLDAQMREIAEGLKRSQKREQYQLVTSVAVRHRDIHRAILEHEPQIIHFCGEGKGEEGLVFEDENGQVKLVTGEALAGLCKLFAEQVECVVLNACFSQHQAEAIVQHISYVVGMSQAISTQTALEFAVGFYDALGAGKDYQFAYKLGCNGIEMAGISENLIPQLFCK